MIELDETFESFMNFAQSTLRATDVELARLLCVSTATIVRWRTGKSRPHPLGQTAATAMLFRAIKEQDIIPSPRECKECRNLAVALSQYCADHNHCAWPPVRCGKYIESRYAHCDFPPGHVGCCGIIIK